MSSSEKITIGKEYLLNEIRHFVKDDDLLSISISELRELRLKIKRLYNKVNDTFRHRVI